MGTHALIDKYRLHAGMGPKAHGLRTFTKSRGIRTFAYGAVGEPGPSEELLSSPVLEWIGDAHRQSLEEVALQWVLQTGTAMWVRPTTDFGLGVSTCDGPKCEAGIKARASSCSWFLTTNDMANSNALTAPDDDPTLFSSSGCPEAFLIVPK
jgi:hypothetical protein